jgi:hypothetical protein
MVEKETTVLCFEEAIKPNGNLISKPSFGLADFASDIEALRRSVLQSPTTDS